MKYATIAIWNRVAGILFVGAAFAKSLNLSASPDVFAYFGIGPLSAATLAMGLICFESWLGTWLVVRGSSLAPTKIALIVFALFTVVLTYFYSRDDSPDCNCLGLLQAAAEAKRSHLYGIFRNGFFVMTGSFVLWRALNNARIRNVTAG